MHSPKVLIVGGGPTGLGLALTLLRNGVPVRIIDKRSAYSVGQRGAGILPRTQEAYNHLGIFPEMTVSCSKVPQMRFYELPGGTKPIKTVVMDPNLPPTPAIPYPASVVLGQDLQERILRSHIEKYSCHLELNTELQSIEQHVDGVSVTLVHNDKSGEESTEKAEFEYMIGTDGAHSTTRKLLGAEFLGETSENEHMVVADIKIKSGLDHEFWHAWGTTNDRMVTIRSACLGNEVFVIMMYGVNLDRNRVSSSREELIKEIYDITGRTDIEFGDLVWLSQYLPSTRMVPKLRHGRVFLAGDAAHCHSHLGAQGMNAGFLDSFNLGWKLSLVLKGLSSPILLDTYDEERVPVIEDLLNKTRAVLRATFKPQDKSGSEWRRGRDLHMLGIHYRSSIIIEDSPPQSKPNETYIPENEATARAGDRAPDAPDLHDLKNPGESASLFQIYRCHYHTILVFSKDIEGYTDILEACQEKPTGAIRTCLIVPELGTSADAASHFDYVFSDHQGYAFGNYHIADASPLKIVAVRPDGVIGAVVDDAEGLRKYFSKIFFL